MVIGVIKLNMFIKTREKMKKVVRMSGLCALVALAFSACEKIDTTKVSFTATINQPTTNTRTHAMGLNNDYFLVWDEGACVSTKSCGRLL